MNILTFDIEEWALAKARNFGTAENYAEYDVILNKILEALDVRGVKGTFFCTGAMAVEFPHVVRLIQSHGHEIGCHSYSHSMLNKMTESEALEDTRRSVDSLEQCIGRKVISYRAPAFSIGENNKWMFNILTECGIERDASIFPAKRDFGGFSNFGSCRPCWVERNGIRLKEFPIPIASILGKAIAYSGGGYFRLLPLCYVKKQVISADYVMMYFHVDDISHVKESFKSREEYEIAFRTTASFIERYKRYLKANIGRRNAFEKMIQLMDCVNYVDLGEADGAIDWTHAPVVTL